MLVLFALSILGKSSNFEINFKESDYDLFLNSSGVFIRRLDAEKADIVYSSTNIEDFTVNLSIGLNFDESKEKNLLNITVDPIKVNLNLEIEYLNGKVKYPGICVHDKENYDTDFFNYYTITIHSNAIFYYDMKDLAIGTIEAYSTSNQLITRVSLSEYKFFYDSYSYICYKRTDCLQNFEIGPYDSYFIATDDEMLNLFINDVYLNEYDESFYILFGDEISDFPQIKEKISEKNVHLMGILKNPTELKIDNEVNIDNLILTNVKFVKKNENDVLDLLFNSISIDDETKNVFPTNDCKITCNIFYEYRTNGDSSQFASITASVKECYYISPDFENNGDVFLHVKNDVVEVKNSEGKTMATVPIKSSYSKIEIHIENQKNPNNNKIVIKNDFANLDQNLEESFDIFFENCGQIPIDFIDWNDEKLSNFVFNINNDLFHVYEVKVTNFNSTFLSYSYNIDDKNYFNFPSEAKKVVFCLFAETCSKEELAGNNVYQAPINGQDITEINNQITNYIQTNPSIEKLFLVLNEKIENEALNLPADIKNLKFLSFIYNNSGDKLLPITLLSFPANQIDLEIIKCNITVNGEAKIGKLFVSENGLINVDNVNQIPEKIVDISKNNEEIDLSGSNEMKLIVKSSNSPHNLIFKSNGQFERTIYIQANDRNYIDIPISFQTEGASSKLDIRTINHERIVFTSIPANIETTIKFDDTEIVQHYIPSNSKDKVSICYNNDLCNQYENDEMYFSSLTENDFTSLMKLLKEDENHIYQYIRLIFHNNVDYENVDFTQIPANQTSQVQLSSYGDTGEAYLILNSDIETENIRNWQLEPKVFFWRSNDDKFFYFDDVSFKSADESFILEMLDNIYENYYFESFHLPSEFSSIYNYVIDSNLLNNFGKFYIEITPENDVCNIQCKDDTVIFDNNEDNAIQNPDFSNIYLQILDDKSQNTNVKINRTDNSIDQVNLIITKKTGSVTIDFECTEENSNDDFELNLYKLKDISVNVNKNKCNEIVYYIINDVQSPPETNETDEHVSSSSEFEFTQEGCTSKEKGNFTVIDSAINRILFTERIITISEKDGNESPTPLYFVPVVNNSIILIKENVIKSSIGVASNNSPRVKLEKNENPLSFFNDLIEGGSIEIKYKPENNDETSLIFKEVNNQQGSFYLNTPAIFEDVSFSDIKLSRTSSFEVKHTKSTSTEAKLLISDDDEEPILKVSDSVFVSPESNSALRNLELNGTLHIYPDSTLNLTGNTSFLNNSSVNLSITNLSQIDDHLLICCEEPLETIPESIIVNLLTDDFDDDDRDKLKNLKIIGPLNSTDLCNDLGDAIVFENNKGLQFNHNCIESESGEILLTFSVKEKKKSKKLGTGAIIGIVISCVVVVAIIIGIIVYCVKRKNNIDISTDEKAKNNDDELSVGF